MQMTKLGVTQPKTLRYNECLFFTHTRQDAGAVNRNSL